jgi:parallel beta-helix repeat protein
VVVEENTIRFNHFGGIVVEGGSGNQILANAIDRNGGLGIDLAENGVTPNDPLDADTGPNDLQNYPILTDTSIGTGATFVSGTFNSTPNRTFRVEFFRSDVPDPSGFGEGRTFIGFITVTTDAAGNAPIAATLPPVPADQVITATATDLTALNTSEFSNAIGPGPAPILSVGGVTVVEGDSGVVNAVIRVELSEPSDSDVTFEFATADGTATASGDYTPTTGSGVIPAGSIFTTITVPVIGDTVVEPEETFFVDVTNIFGATGADVQGEGIIENDDAATGPPAGIPTLSEWAMALMAVFLALAGAIAMRT